ncbi:putative non-structural maintenance of chromosomes element 1 [Blattamonas nauphoetae]|uniref:Non-structural maintenance of chromosomes element 1 homolog n=1 Tax=Blattamonas nauphoetae TaxID=2049346 RepID=A0ABQ9YM35_9EUKA|nr:putative non-structural maintenance of chromosomes element 1 [Blattamonas nauphoetae]
MDRQLFQLLLRNGPVVTEDTITERLHLTPGEIDACLVRLNNRLNAFALRINSVIFGQDSCLGIINVKDDSASKLGTPYTPTEISYFKQILKILLLDGEDSLVDLEAEIGRQSSVNPEKLVRQLVKDKWLAEENKMIAFGQRSFLELETNLIAISEQIGGLANICCLCSALHIGCSGSDKGVKCAHCAAKMHKRCQEDYSKRFHLCPQCRRPAEWEPIIGRRRRLELEAERLKSEGLPIPADGEFSLLNLSHPLKRRRTRAERKAAMRFEGDNDSDDLYENPAERRRRVVPKVKQEDPL